jgi:hypothetical protein
VPALHFERGPRTTFRHVGDPQLAHDDRESHNALQVYLLGGNPQNPT